MEAKGKQDLWTKRKPEVLQSLREQATIQSAESSNRIEGVTISANRLRPLLIGKSKPRDRSEEELDGYRKALDWIFKQKQSIPINSRVILKLHELAQGGSMFAGRGDAGQWKQRNNEIIEMKPDGRTRIRFIPASAKQAPRLIEELCSNFTEARESNLVHSPLLIATFVFDFLCIHPFRDGNGRVSRLLTTLLLQSSGFEVARYISLERSVEETKSEYYDVLERCSKDWHVGANEIIPWWNYFLGRIRTSYRELERQVEAGSSGSAKSSLVEMVILEQSGDFTLAELNLQLPNVSPQLVKKVLAEMKRNNRIQLQGRGRGASWRVV